MRLQQPWIYLECEEVHRTDRLSSTAGEHGAGFVQQLALAHRRQQRQLEASSNDRGAG